MKCKFVVDVDIEPKSMPPEMARHVQYRDAGTREGVKKFPYWPAGTEYEIQNAAFFVRQGMAEPADDECRVACGMDPQQMQVVQHAYQRQARGILPKDWEHFDAGYIVGYDEKGDYLPGPKWDEYQAKLAAEEDSDDDL